MNMLCTCNHCSERLKGKRKAKDTESAETIITNTDDYRSVTLSRSSSSSRTISENKIANELKIQSENNPDVLLYELNKVCNVISTSNSIQCIHLKSWLDTELIEMASIVQLTNDQKAIKDKFLSISFGQSNQVLVTIGKYVTYVYVRDISS